MALHSLAFGGSWTISSQPSKPLIPDRALCSLSLVDSLVYVSLASSAEVALILTDLRGIVGKEPIFARARRVTSIIN